MPTLFRLIVIIAVLAGLVYGSMLALVAFVEPQTAEISVRVPADKLNPPQ